MMSSLNAGDLPPQAGTGAAEAHPGTARPGAGQVRKQHDEQQTGFYRDARFAMKNEIASAMHRELKHNHPLAKFKRRRNKPLVLNRPVRRPAQAEARPLRADHGVRRHERPGRDGRHHGGGQGQGRGQGQSREQERQKDGERREDNAQPVVKVQQARRIDPAATSGSVLAAVQDASTPPAQLEHDMRRTLTVNLLGIAKLPPGHPGASVTARVLGLALDLNAAQQLLRKRGIALRGTGLAGVKQLLMDVQANAPRGGTPLNERERSLHLLVPLMLLGAERPSTPHQLALAENRLRSGLAAVGAAPEQTDTPAAPAAFEASQNP